MIAIDQGIRDAALDTGRCFAVSAPAGSGKTGLLIRRILRLLAKCDQPEQVLAITFTRKAAAEMRDRIIKALTAASGPKPGEPYEEAIWRDARVVLERDRERDWHLMSYPGRLRIMTIDSLCRHLARQLALETGLGDLPEPTDQPEKFYREAVRALFEELEKPGQTAEDLGQLLRHLDNNLGALESLLVGLLAKREQWLRPLYQSRNNQRAGLERALENTVMDTLQQCREQLAIYEGEISSFANYAAANLAHNNIDSPIRQLEGGAGLPEISVSADCLAQWQGITELLLTRENQWRKPGGVNKKLGFPSAPKECANPETAKERKQQFCNLLEELSGHTDLLNALVDLRHLPDPHFDDRQWQILETLTRLLPNLVAQLTVSFQNRQNSDFTEITLAAIEALGDETAPTDLALKLDYQIRHILVDEFQDTSTVQFELLRKLTAGWQPDDGRTLFIVGDGMQSLYGFRNANVGLFLEARRQAVGDIQLEALDLAVNFRSYPAVVDWVNTLFASVFPHREDISRGAVAYSPAQPAKSVPDGAVTVDIFANNTDAEAEAKRVVELIRQAQSHDPEASIAVLGRARGHLTPIITALQAENIPWLATDMDSLASRMVVMDLLSLTRALLNPADRIAWLSVLRAPWCGFQLADLHCIVNHGHDCDGKPDQMPWIPGQLFREDLLPALSPDGRQRLSRIGPLLRAAIGKGHRKPLRQWVEGTWIALGGPAALISADEYLWCQQYFDLLEREARGTSLPDMSAFSEAVARLYAKPQTSAENPVQVMTIHKSKGLEFDTVIVPGLHRGGGSNETSLLYWRERINQHGHPELLISPPQAVEFRDSEDSRLVKHLKYEEKQKSALEDARVIYVACTRAVKHLHLLYAEPKNGPTQGSLLAALWPAFSQNQFGNAQIRRHESAIDESSETQEAPVLNKLLRLKADWQAPLDTGLAPASTIETDRVSEENAEADDEARHTGTVLHRTLCQIVREGLALWDEKRIKRQLPSWRLQLRGLGVASPDQLLPRLERAVTRMLADEQGRWLLEDHEESAAELALGYLGAEGPREAIVDRTFIDRGVRWIVDYKSSEPSPGQSLSVFLASEAESYRGQLALYAGILANLGPHPIRKALYFPLIPAFYELD